MSRSLIPVSPVPPPAKRPEDFPPSVHAGLAELRGAVKACRSREERKLLRRATPDEVALAEALRAPGHCRAHSPRTGLPCGQPAMTGGTVCRAHGGGTVMAQRKAREQLAIGAAPALRKLRQLLDSDNEKVSIQAVKDWLDRAGIGEPVQAKVRASKRAGATDKAPAVQVKIGFLSKP